MQSISYPNNQSSFVSSSRRMHRYGAIITNSGITNSDEESSGTTEQYMKKLRNVVNILVMASVFILAAALLAVNDRSAFQRWQQQQQQQELDISSSTTTTTNDSLLRHSSYWKLLTKAKRIDYEKEMKQERFYHNQLVDHFTDDSTKQQTWSNRYYKSTKYFAGPGNPIFLIVGGEDATDDGMFYPYVTEHLAKYFHAAVVQVEHRFYGPYVPIKNATSKQLMTLLTPHQAMADMIKLVTHLREHEFHCSEKRNAKKKYCPIITVGASYPGFLSAMFRVVYPNIVDISYASSAPVLMYAQQVDPTIYYDIVTRAAETSSPGCSKAVHLTLKHTYDTVSSQETLEEAAKVIGICPESIPSYIVNASMLATAISQITGFKFADDNMGNYPPGNTTDVYKTCQVFQQDNNKEEDEERNNESILSTMHKFLMHMLPDSNTTSNACFDLMTQFPKDGLTLEDTDGDYNDGKMWDFQTCLDVVFLMGYSSSSMFYPPSVDTYEHLTDHCRARFGVTPRPYQLVEEWGFDDLTDASYILFTNGMQDLWSGGSYLYNVSDTVLALNFENGAHHSDLTHVGPSPDHDTDDIRQGHIQIQTIIENWLSDIQKQN